MCRRAQFSDQFYFFFISPPSGKLLKFWLGSSAYCWWPPTLYKRNSVIDSIAFLEAYLDSLRIWHCHNGLCLNFDKSESILFGTTNACRHSLWFHPSKLQVMTSNFLIKSQVLVSSWTLLSPLMHPSRFFARHATFILDLFYTLGAHSQLTWLSRSLSQWCIRDYCNFLLYGISAFNINKLQQVQNLAAKIAFNDWDSPSQELLSQLHWLPLHSRIKFIKFKISSLTFKLLAENQPANLRSLMTLYVPPCLLRSSDKSLLVQPPTRTSIGKRTFSVSAPYVWNSIPLPIRLSPMIASFKRNLKTYYFVPA